MQVEGRNSLPVVDSDDITVDVEFTDNLYDARRDGADGNAFGPPLVKARVIIAGGLPIMQPLYSERGNKAAGDRLFERLRPVSNGTHGVAQCGERLHFSGSRLERTQTGRELNILSLKPCVLHVQNGRFEDLAATVNQFEFVLPLPYERADRNQTRPGSVRICK